LDRKVRKGVLDYVAGLMLRRSKPFIKKPNLSGKGGVSRDAPVTAMRRSTFFFYARRGKRKIQEIPEHPGAPSAGMLRKGQGGAGKYRRGIIWMGGGSYRSVIFMRKNDGWKGGQDAEIWGCLEIARLHVGRGCPKKKLSIDVSGRKGF